MEFLHDGVPRLTRKAVVERRRTSPSRRCPTCATTTRSDLLAILSSPTVASKEWVIRQYDHEVQGADVIKPLVGRRPTTAPRTPRSSRPSSATRRRVIISNGINPSYGDIDPYHMAANAIDEALRQVIAVGGSLERTAILDNFCWGNTRQARPARRARARRQGLLRRRAASTARRSSAARTASTTNSRPAALPSSSPARFSFSAIAVLDDVSRAVTMDLKSGRQPSLRRRPDRRRAGRLAVLQASRAHRQERPRGRRRGRQGDYGRHVARDARRDAYAPATTLSDGGLAVAIAEMAFAGGLGAEVALDGIATKGGDLESARGALLGEPARDLSSRSSRARLRRSKRRSPACRSPV